MGWLWLIRFYRFQVYNAITYHLYIVLCVTSPSQVSFQHHSQLFLFIQRCSSPFGHFFFPWNIHWTCMWQDAGDGRREIQSQLWYLSVLWARPGSAGEPEMFPSQGMFPELLELGEEPAEGGAGGCGRERAGESQPSWFPCLEKKQLDWNARNDKVVGCDRNWL